MDKFIEKHKLLTLEKFKSLQTHRKLAYFKKKRGIQWRGFCDC